MPISRDKGYKYPAISTVVIYFVMTQLNSTDPCSHTWLGYIAAEVVRQCITLANAECLACANKISSPLLHFHNELNLKEKMARYMKNVTLNVDELFDQFVLQFGWFSLSRDQYIQIGNTFLLFSTPDAIFYGKYITPQNDKAIYNLHTQDFTSTTEPTQPIGDPLQLIQIDNLKRKIKTPKKSIKSKTSRTGPTSQNDISG